jgi:DNA-binding response OmpR family regulator
MTKTSDYSAETFNESAGTPLDVVLVVEDTDIGMNLAVEALEMGGFASLTSNDGAQALETIRSQPLDAVLLDLGLPSMSGFDVLEEARRSSDVPIIIVSGRLDEGDRVQGLRLGADDYVTKPYSPRELVERVHAAIRRGGKSCRTTTLVFDDMTIDLAAREVSLGGRIAELTPLEYELLAFLAAAPRRAFSRAELLREVWSSSTEWQTEATVTEHVRRLRGKIDAPDHKVPRIVTVHRAGYRFEP